MILEKSGYLPRAFSMFIHSCWNAGLLNDAIARLKKLIDVAENRLAIIVMVQPTKLSGASAGTRVTVTHAGKKIAAVISSIDYNMEKRRSVLRIMLRDQSVIKGAAGHAVKVTWP